MLLVMVKLLLKLIMISIHQTVTGQQNENISTDPITTNQCPAYGVVS